jgi:hypothetical protein
MKRYLLTLFALFILTGAVYADRRMQPTTIAGFVNLGAEADDNINVLLSMSLINMLQMIPGAIITPWNQVEQAAREENLWGKKEVDVDATLALALSFDTRRVITGDYLVSRGKVKINMYVYDVAMGELVVRRSWEGDTGLDLFDTIDRVIMTATPIIAGRRSFQLGKLNISANVREGVVYKVYVNNVFQKELKKDAPFDGQILAGEPVEVSIRLVDGDEEKEVLRRAVNIEENEEFKLEYTPAGTVIIKAPSNPNAKVLVNDEEVGVLDRQGEFTIYNIPADKSHTIVISQDDKIIRQQRVSLREGQSYIMVAGMGERNIHFPLRLMAGGLGASVGASFTFAQRFLTSASFGGIYIPSQEQFVIVADLDFGYNFLRLGDFKFYGLGGVFFHFTDPIIVSPTVKIQAEWKRLFIDMGVRISLNPDIGADGNLSYVKPLVGIGFRF